MKRIKIKKLVLTDGEYYFETSSAYESIFTRDPRKAWNFYSETFPTSNQRRRLHWEIETWTKHTPVVYSKNSNGKYKVDPNIVIDRSKFHLKWITIIETIKVEDFDYEGFSNANSFMFDEKYEELI